MVTLYDYSRLLYHGENAWSLLAFQSAVRGSKPLTYVTVALVSLPGTVAVL